MTEGNANIKPRPPLTRAAQVPGTLCPIHQSAEFGQNKHVNVQEKSRITTSSILVFAFVYPLYCSIAIFKTRLVCISAVTEIFTVRPGVHQYNDNDSTSSGKTTHRRPLPCLHVPGTLGTETRTRSPGPSRSPRAPPIRAVHCAFP